MDVSQSLVTKFGVEVVVESADFLYEVFPGEVLRPVLGVGIKWRDLSELVRNMDVRSISGRSGEGEPK
jgi:hypothetical protein